MGRQGGANQISMSKRKAKLLHFSFGFLGRPALLGHAVGSYHHSRAVVTQTAMDENLFAWVLPQQRKKLSEYFVFWKLALPR